MYVHKVCMIEQNNIRFRRTSDVCIEKSVNSNLDFLLFEANPDESRPARASYTHNAPYLAAFNLSLCFLYNNLTFLDI